MKNLILLITVVASVCCAIVSYLTELPLLVTLLFTAMGILNIWYVVAFTKWKSMDLEGNIVLIPTLVIDRERGNKDVALVWLNCGVTISEKGE